MPPDGTLEQKFALRHKVTFLCDSVFEEIFCKKEIKVNSSKELEYSQTYVRKLTVVDKHGNEFEIN